MVETFFEEIRLALESGGERQAVGGSAIFQLGTSRSSPDATQDR